MASCQEKLAVQPKILPYAENPLKPGDAARRPIDGTFAYNPAQKKRDLPRELSVKASVEERKAFLARGQERFQIYCSVCHGLTGDGHGMAVERGMRAPPSYTSDALLHTPLSHIVTVIEEGYGNMMPYGDRIFYKDRWAIAAYVRALQLSQKFPVKDLDEENKKRLGP